MSLNFYQGKDTVAKNLIRKQPNNSIVFSNDRLKMYGMFSNTSSPFSEQRNLVYEDDYNSHIPDREKLNNRQTYYCVDGDITLDYPVGIGVNHGSLVILTNEEL